MPTVPSKEQIQNMQPDEIHALFLEFENALKNLDQIQPIKKIDNEKTLRQDFFIMKLATKEQELRESITQIQSLKASLMGPIVEKLEQTSELVQTGGVSSTSQPKNDSNLAEQSKSQQYVVLTDPAINYLYSRTVEQFKDCKARLKDAQDELSASTFSLESINGRKLIAKCRQLEIENEELGREFTDGRFRQMDIALKIERKHRLKVEESIESIDRLIASYESQIESLQSIIVRQKQDIDNLLANRSSTLS